LIHRSAFFHPINFEMGFGSRPPEEGQLQKNWDLLYQILDDKLVCFIGYVGTVELRTHFLIYSRGTDPSWRDMNYRVQWAKNIGDRFPMLKNRVYTMHVKPASSNQQATFHNPETKDEIRRLVQDILDRP